MLNRFQIVVCETSRVTTWSWRRVRSLRCLCSTRLCAGWRACSPSACPRAWPCVSAWGPAGCCCWSPAAWESCSASASTSARTTCSTPWRPTEGRLKDAPRLIWASGEMWDSSFVLHKNDVTDVNNDKGEGGWSGSRSRSSLNCETNWNKLFLSFKTDTESQSGVLSVSRTRPDLCCLHVMDSFLVNLTFYFLFF